jgi:hypothetical protein
MGGVAAVPIVRLVARKQVVVAMCWIVVAAVFHAAEKSFLIVEMPVAVASWEVHPTTVQAHPLRPIPWHIVLSVTSSTISTLCTSFVHILLCNYQSVPAVPYQWFAVGSLLDSMQPTWLSLSVTFGYLQLYQKCSDLQRSTHF